MISAQKTLIRTCWEIIRITADETDLTKREERPERRRIARIHHLLDKGKCTAVELWLNEQIMFPRNGNGMIIKAWNVS